MNNNLKPEIKSFLDKIVTTNKVIEALSSIKNVHQMSGVQGSGMLLLGNPGLGKSTILKKYYKANIKIVEDDHLTTINIIKISIPAKPTIKSVIISILEKANHPVLTGTESQLTLRLNKIIKNQKVELLMFDEFQHLLREQAHISTHNVLNFIKTIMDENKIAIVMAGITSAKKIFSNYDELYQRFSYEIVHLYAYSLNSAYNIQNLRKYLNALHKILADLGIKIIPLNSDEIIQRIFLATDGIPRYIARLYYRILLISDLNNTITIDDFKKAYLNLNANVDNDLFNPFSVSSKEKLIKMSGWNNV